MMTFLAGGEYICERGLYASFMPVVRDAAPGEKNPQARSAQAAVAQT
jgi:hypothetical protein